jgi:hypothetical protein
MAEQWYYTRQGQRFGPLSIEQIRQLALAGQLQQTDLVWTEGMAEWTPAGRCTQLFAPAAAVPGVLPGVAPGMPVAAASPSPAAAESGGGLFDTLDLNFSRSVTTVIVRWLWIIYLILAPLAFFVSVLGALFALRGFHVVVAIVAQAVGLVLTTLLVRVWLETVCVIFRIADYLRDMQQTQKASAGK